MGCSEIDAVRIPAGGPQGAERLVPGFVEDLRGLAVRALARMYRPEERLFVFRLRRWKGGIVSEGLSRRYTAIALIGLAGEEERTAASVLGGHRLDEVCGRLVEDISCADNLGDVALMLWAARAIRFPDRGSILQRLLALQPDERKYPVVEIAWALSALCIDSEAQVGDLRGRLGRRLSALNGRRSGLFPHVGSPNGVGLRGHVACFADQVYPIHALSHLHRLAGNRSALEVASRCAGRICGLQGAAGQWWWHYDWRTGEVVERYPVYAIHQDAMAPMALSALREAGGPDYSREVDKGLVWVGNPPELDGRSLVDEEADLVWRKVARREPGKMSRYLQAAAARLHPGLRVPGLDAAFPPKTVDYEDRPYHLGWLLYAWPARRDGLSSEREGCR